MTAFPPAIQSPLVSIVIPCFNSEAFILKALQSCLVQSYQNIEVIVVDDGSTDQTVEIINNFCSHNQTLSIKLCRHIGGANKGTVASRMLGFENSCGDFIALLDSDDFFKENHIEGLASCLLDNPKVVMCHSAVNVFAEYSSFDPIPHERHFSSSPERPYKLSDLKDFMYRLHICNSSVSTLR